MTHEFDEYEVGYLKSLVRQEIRKQDKKLDRLTKTFGAEADLEPTHEKLDMLAALYRKLGGDPENITMTEATS